MFYTAIDFQARKNHTSHSAHQFPFGGGSQRHLPFLHWSFLLLAEAKFISFPRCYPFVSDAISGCFLENAIELQRVMVAEDALQRKPSASFSDGICNWGRSDVPLNMWLFLFFFRCEYKKTNVQTIILGKRNLWRGWLMGMSSEVISSTKKQKIKLKICLKQNLHQTKPISKHNGN